MKSVGSTSMKSHMVLILMIMFFLYFDEIRNVLRKGKRKLIHNAKSCFGRCEMVNNGDGLDDSKILMDTKINTLDMKIKCTSLDEYELFIPLNSQHIEIALGRYYWKYYDAVKSCENDENLNDKIQKRCLSINGMCSLIAKQREVKDMLFMEARRKMTTPLRTSKAFHILDAVRMPETYLVDNRKFYSRALTNSGEQQPSPSFVTVESIACKYSEDGWFHISQGVGPNSFLVSVMSKEKGDMKIMKMISHVTFGRKSDGCLYRLHGDETQASLLNCHLQNGKSLWIFDKNRSRRDEESAESIWVPGWIPDSHPSIEMESDDNLHDIKRIVDDIPLFYHSETNGNSIEEDLINYYKEYSHLIEKCQIDEPLSRKLFRYRINAKKLCELVLNELNVSIALRLTADTEIKNSAKIEKYHSSSEYEIGSSAAEINISNAVKCDYTRTQIINNLVRRKRIVEDSFYISQGVGGTSFFVFAENWKGSDFEFKAHVTFDVKDNRTLCSIPMTTRAFLRMWDLKNGKLDWLVYYLPDERT